jgi:hypothetical protein
VLPGTYSVALVVDGKTVDTKPLHVAADPEVVLTSVERKRLYDMAMEMHELQRRATEVSTEFGTLNRETTTIAGTIAGKSEVPADVKTSFEAFHKEVTALAPKLAAPAAGRGFGGGGGGRGGANESVLAKVGQAKNGLMGGIWPTAQTLRAYNEAKVEVPKAVADGNALFTKAAAMSATLAKYNLALTAPAAVK